MRAACFSILVVLTPFHNALGAEPAKSDVVSAYAAEPESTPKSPALEAIESASAGKAPTSNVPVTAAPTPARMPLVVRAARSGESTEVAAPAVADEQRECLARAIYFEARGESRDGQVAVAQVVLNRVHNPDYPDTICGVVYQNKHRKLSCQFSFVCDGKPDKILEKKAWAKAQEVALEVTSGQARISDIARATHYHATYVSPRWAPAMDKLAKIGTHIFYRG